jgi:uncharacterized protein YbbK (DUF523 family)
MANKAKDKQSKKDADRLKLTELVKDRHFSGFNLKTVRSCFVNFQVQLVTINMIVIMKRSPSCMEHRLVKAQFLRVLKN